MTGATGGTILAEVLVDDSHGSGVRVLSMRREGRRNADGMDMRSAILDALQAAAAAPEVRACILRGDGGTFSSGADLGNADTHRVESVSDRLGSRRPLPDYFGLVARFPKPLIAVVDGYAIGAGFVLALCADIIVCAADAQLQLPQVKLGILPAQRAVVRLMQRTGKARAMDLALTGRRIGAAEALTFGVADRVVEVGEGVDKGVRIANAISGSREAVHSARQSMRASYEDRLIAPDGIEVDRYRQLVVMTSKDAARAHENWREQRSRERHAAAGTSGSAEGSR